MRNILQMSLIKLKAFLLLFPLFLLTDVDLQSRKQCVAVNFTYFFFGIGYLKLLALGSAPKQKLSILAILPRAINRIMTAIGLFRDPRKMMHASSVMKPVKNWRVPTEKARQGAANSSGWFTRYFIIWSPWASSAETWRCIMIEHTNLAASTDIEAGIVILN